MPGESCVIRCFAKVRPTTANDSKTDVRLNGDKVAINIDGSDSSFNFDGVYGPETSMRHLYKEKCEPMLHRLIEGTDVSIVALGSTGSGKSYLLNGIEESPGIVPCMIEGLFEVIERMKKKEFFVTVSYVDILGNELIDLINPHTAQMKVRTMPQGGVCIDGLSALVVSGPDQLLQYYDQGTRARKYGTTNARMHREQATSVLMVRVEQKEPGARQSVALRSCLTIVDLAGIDSDACKGLIHCITALSKKDTPPVRDSRLTMVLQEVFGGNSLTSVFTTLHPGGKKNLDALQLSQPIRSIKHNVSINMDDTDQTIADLREEISLAREKVLKQPGDREGVNQLSELVRVLQITKQHTWEERQKLSIKYEQERKNNLANRGMLEWVMDTKQKHKLEIEERLSTLQAEREKLATDYRAKQDAVHQINSQLQQMIAEYSTLSTSGKASTADTKTKFAAIHDMKDRLKQAKDSQQSLRTSLKDNQQRLRLERDEAAKSSNNQANSELAYLVEIEERRRIEGENSEMLKEELDRTRAAFEQETADIKMKVVEGKTSQELADLETKIAQLHHEKPVIALEIQTLTQEKDRLTRVVDEMHQKHHSEMEKQQLQHLQTFRNYREMFEKHKAALETRYRDLLDGAIQDAVFLSSKNSELVDQNTELRNEINRLKDRITQRK